MAGGTVPRLLRSHLNWVRAAILAANDGIVSVTALSLGVAAARPSALFVVTAAACIAGSTSMAAGEFMSVSMLSDVDPAVSPVAAAAASGVAFLAGAAIPAIAVVFTPQHIRIPVVFAAALVAMIVCGYAGSKLSNIRAAVQIARVVIGGVLAVGVTVAALAII